MSDSGPSFGSAHDPWDAPYFGAPIYLAYPAFQASSPGAVNGIATFRAQAEQHLAAPIDSPAAPISPVQRIELAPAPTPRRRGWLARLFGAR
jgi:hypothetical protein